MIRVLIPVEYVSAGNGHTYRYVCVEAVPLRILRQPTGARRAGFFYVAIIRHPDVVGSAWGVLPDGTYRAQINRTLNPKWKPPVFPSGTDCVDVPAVL